MLGLALPVSEITANKSSIREESVFDFLLSLATQGLSFRHRCPCQKSRAYLRFSLGGEPFSRLAIAAFGMVSLLVPIEFNIAASS